MNTIISNIGFIVLILLLIVVGLRFNRYFQYRMNASNQAALVSNMNELRQSEVVLQPAVLAGVKPLGVGANQNHNGVTVILSDSYDQLSKQQQIVAQNRIFASWVAIVQRNRVGNSKAEIQLNDSMYRPVARYIEP